MFLSFAILLPPVSNGIDFKVSSSANCPIASCLMCEWPEVTNAWPWETRVMTPLTNERLTLTPGLSGSNWCE